MYIVEWMVLRLQEWREKAQRRENYIRHVNGRQVFPTSLRHQYSASGNMEICHEQEGGTSGWLWSSSAVP